MRGGGEVPQFRIDLADCGWTDDGVADLKRAGMKFAIYHIYHISPLFKSRQKWKKWGAKNGAKEQIETW